MEHWVVDDVQDAGKWLVYDESGKYAEGYIKVAGPKELAQRVADGLNDAQN